MQACVQSAIPHTCAARCLQSAGRLSRLRVCTLQGLAMGAASAMQQGAKAGLLCRSGLARTRCCRRHPCPRLVCACAAGRQVGGGWPAIEQLLLLPWRVLLLWQELLLRQVLLLWMLLRPGQPLLLLLLLLLHCLRRECDAPSCPAHTGKKA